MDYIDYRERLGLGFNDDEKGKIFINRIQTFFMENYDYALPEQTEREFCYSIGKLCDLDNDLSNLLNDQLDGLQRICIYLRDEIDFKKVLAMIVVFANLYSEQELILDGVRKALSDTHIGYEILDEDGNYFIFPKGAMELDDALVSEPLRWLNNYPGTHKTYCAALKQYAEGEYSRDVADNLRKSLETFLQEVLDNKKNLETNKNEICKYLAEKSIDSDIWGFFQPLINTYKNFNDKYVKHNDAVDVRLLEFMLYQTGILFRMIITVKNTNNN